jgi:O-antigen biosynthesis protein
VSQRPLVSVIVVTHGRWDLAEQALDAVRDRTEVPHEVIVVDNASTDGTRAGLQQRPEVTTVLNETNLGFGPAVNQGVVLARGRFLCLLNSDAFVEERWLPPLLEALEDPRVAAAVPEVLNMDGTLQEAGALVSGDGRTVAFGRGSDPDHPGFTFPRFVDYGSALCMLIRKEAFVEAGGFDPAYRIGYCEDVDLCFRLAERGYLVRYEPHSRVRHVGGASGDPAVVEELVRANTHVLRSRWPERLSRRPPLGEWHLRPHRLIESRDIEVTDRILVVDEVVPSLDGSRGRLSTARLLESLATGWPRARVTLLSVRALEAEEARWLLDSGVEVVGASADPEAWFRDRLLHATLVVSVGPVPERVYGELLRRTQPQALAVYLAEEPLETGVATSLRSAETEAIRRADVVWSASAGKLRLAVDLAPATPRFAVPERGWDVEGLAGVVAPLGVAPPEPRLLSTSS